MPQTNDNSLPKDSIQEDFEPEAAESEDVVFLRNFIEKNKSQVYYGLFLVLLLKESLTAVQKNKNALENFAKKIATALIQDKNKSAMLAVAINQGAEQTNLASMDVRTFIKFSLFSYARVQYLSYAEAIGKITQQLNAMLGKAELDLNRNIFTIHASPQRTYKEYQREVLLQTAEQLNDDLESFRQQVGHNSFWIDLYQELIRPDTVRNLSLRELNKNAIYYVSLFFTALFMLAEYMPQSIARSGPGLSVEYLAVGLIAAISIISLLVLCFKQVISKYPRIVTNALVETLDDFYELTIADIKREEPVKAKELDEKTATYVKPGKQEVSFASPTPTLAVYLVNRQADDRIKLASNKHILFSDRKTNKNSPSSNNNVQMPRQIELKEITWEIPELDITIPVCVNPKTGQVLRDDKKTLSPIKQVDTKDNKRLFSYRPYHTLCSQAAVEGDTKFFEDHFAKNEAPAENDLRKLTDTVERTAALTYNNRVQSYLLDREEVVGRNTQRLFSTDIKAVNDQAILSFSMIYSKIGLHKKNKLQKSQYGNVVLDRRDVKQLTSTVPKNQFG